MPLRAYLRQRARLIEGASAHVQQMQKALVEMNVQLALVASPRQPQRGVQHNEPAFDVRTPLYRVAGADLAQLDGIGPYTAVRLVAQIGTDMTPHWPTAQHFTSWLTLPPCNKISDGRLLS